MDPGGVLLRAGLDRCGALLQFAGRRGHTALDRLDAVLIGGEDLSVGRRFPVRVGQRRAWTVLVDYLHPRRRRAVGFVL
jgi:hypothetical protein